MTIATPTDVDVLVRQTCRRADMPYQAVRSGAQRQAKLDNADLPGVVRVHGTDCFCQPLKTRCTIVLQAAARWTYIFVYINPVSDFEQLCKCIAGYSNFEDGIVT